MKTKLNVGYIRMDPNNWIQLNRNLDTQNKHTLFEGKIKDIFNNTMPPRSHYN